MPNGISVSTNYSSSVYVNPLSVIINEPYCIYSSIVNILLIPSIIPSGIISTNSVIYLYWTDIFCYDGKLNVKVLL
mgnify:CR=1 FL=1